MLLALDTSTAVAGVALHGEPGPVASLSWLSGRMHTVQLMPSVDWLFHQIGATPAALTGVAVATGPGSFTSLRVGLSTAKGLSVSLGVPLVGIPTLLYTAWPHRRAGVQVRAILPLGRERMAVAAYAPDGASLQHLWTRNRAAEETAEDGYILYCGEMDAGLRGRLNKLPDAIVPAASEVRRDPAVLAELGWERLLQGKTDPPASLQAEYLDSR